jgi:RND family efflux transporter MFP subunit
LVAKKFVSRELFDGVVARQAKAEAAVDSGRAQIAAAEAARRAAQVSVDYTLIKAPFDGVILQKHADIRDVVAPFAATTQSKGAVVSIADLRTLEVEADVSESNISKVMARQPCEILLDAVPNVRYSGEVHRIMPTVDKSKATVVVKVRFLALDDRILPDMSAKVTFLDKPPTEADRKAVTVVPRAAVAARDGAKSVFVVQDGVARAVRVETGREIGEAIEVSGVEPGTRVVVKPLDAPLDGRRVRVESK